MELDEYFYEMIETESITKILKPPPPASCAHINTASNETGVFCVDCGCVYDSVVYNCDGFSGGGQGYMNSKNFTRSGLQKRKSSVTTNLYCEMISYGIKDEHVSRIIDIYHLVSGDRVYRGRTKRSMLFSCSYAYLKREKIDSDSASQMVANFNIDTKSALRGLKHLCMAGYGHTLKNSVVNFIQEQTNLIKCDPQTVAEIIDFYETYVKNRSSLVNRARPASISSGVICFILIVKLENPPTFRDLSLIFEISSLTIRKLSNEIATLVLK